MNNVQSVEDASKNADLVILATNHKAISGLLTPEFLEGKNVRAVLDARNVLDKEGILGKGILFKGIGR